MVSQGKDQFTLHMAFLTWEMVSQGKDQIHSAQLITNPTTATMTIVTSPISV